MSTRVCFCMPMVWAKDWKLDVFGMETSIEVVKILVQESSQSNYAFPKLPFSRANSPPAKRDRPGYGNEGLGYQPFQGRVEPAVKYIRPNYFMVRKRTVTLYRKRLAIPLHHWFTGGWNKLVILQIVTMSSARGSWAAANLQFCKPF